MTNAGHFDFESQSWVSDGDAPPPSRERERERENVSAPRRKRGSAELFLLVGGLIGVGLGLLLLLIAAGTNASGDLPASANFSAIGIWLLRIGVGLLFALLLINAFIDVWQRRMTQPE
jgi:hypothetical protein